MSLNDSPLMISSTQLLFARRSSKLFFVISAYFWLPQASFADCNHIDISNLRWLHNTSELEITFQSKPEKIYELQGSSDLSRFNAIFDVTGATGTEQTIISGPSENLQTRFFKIAGKNTAPTARWFQEYNGSREESHGHFILVCEDGGFLQIGETGIVGRATAKILVVKTDSEGDLEWKKEFGSGNNNMGNSALEVTDGYLICGMLSSNSAIIKLNKNTGATIFSRTHENGGTDAFEHMALLPSGIIAAGYIQAEDGENTFFPYAQGYITFMDSEGNRTSRQSLNAYMSHAYRIEASGTEYIISGTTEDALQFAVVKMNASGTILWNKTFGGNNEDHCFGMDVSDDGSIFLTGHTLSGTANWDTYTMKLDSNGNQLWETKRGNPRGFNPLWIHDETWGIKATCDGGCIISAGTGDEYSYSECSDTVCSDQWEAYIVKFDSNGNVQWEETYRSDDFGEEGDWAAEDIDLTSDGGAIIAVDNGQFGFLKIAPF